MKAGIRRLHVETQFDTSERCSIIEVSNDDDDPDLSIARARVFPGVTTAWHKLKDTAERYLILSGTGQVEIGDDTPQPVAPGDVVRIPPGVPQRITNTSDDDLVFYAICTPRFRQEHYVTLE